MEYLWYGMCCSGYIEGGDGSVLGVYGVGLFMFVMYSVRNLAVFVIYMRRVMCCCVVLVCVVLVI